MIFNKPNYVVLYVTLRCALSARKYGVIIVLSKAVKVDVLINVKILYLLSHTL